MLALLFHIMTDRSSLLLIEEPEVFVHHGLLVTVVEVLKEYSREKQIIFSTHSDAILDHLNPEEVRIVSNNPKSGTEVRPISKAMSVRQFGALKEYLQSVGSLGEYWRQSGFA